MCTNQGAPGMVAAARCKTRPPGALALAIRTTSPTRGLLAGTIGTRSPSWSVGATECPATTTTRRGARGARSRIGSAHNHGLTAPIVAPRRPGAPYAVTRIGRQPASTRLGDSGRRLATDQRWESVVFNRRLLFKETLASARGQGGRRTAATPARLTTRGLRTEDPKRVVGRVFGPQMPVPTSSDPWGLMYAAASSYHHGVPTRDQPKHATYCYC